MKNLHYLKEIVKLQKQGVPQGIYSICSAHPFVIEAALAQALEENTYVLIESTCNQVNQFGGYTGMKPQDFVEFVHSLAKAMAFPPDKILLGGDHLGPNPWQAEPSATAMKKASDLVREYVMAGFTKIHLDTSMHLADDPGDRRQPLDPELVAERTALLGSIAEQAFTEGGKRSPAEVPPLVYVIGTEVPVPGGVQDTLEEPHVTEVADFQETVNVSQAAFVRKGLVEVWERVIAVVVQPGVEFGDQIIYEYQREKARELCNALKEVPNLVLEGHSTDYQRPSYLKQMVEDGVAILKVGPALTFAMREALYLLSYIENELEQGTEGFQPSQLIDVLDTVMVENPGYWEKYYHGSEKERQFARKYSLSDRSRYYWSNPKVQHVLEQLFRNLGRVEIPLPLISQFFPQQYDAIRNGLLEKTPKALIREKIREVLRIYSYAVTPHPDPLPKGARGKNTR
jgi:D-tagatose-1,6-bisphosphate aldolase subunit GatZ/KbaZ